MARRSITFHFAMALRSKLLSVLDPALCVCPFDEEFPLSIAVTSSPINSPGNDSLSPRIRVKFIGFVCLRRLRQRPQFRASLERRLNVLGNESALTRDEFHPAIQFLTRSWIVERERRRGRGSGEEIPGEGKGEWQPSSVYPPTQLGPCCERLSSWAQVVATPCRVGYRRALNNGRVI